MKTVNCICIYYKKAFKFCTESEHKHKQSFMFKEYLYFKASKTNKQSY